MKYTITFTGSEPKPGSLFCFNFEANGEPIAVVTKIASVPGEPVAQLNDWVECAEAWVRHRIARERYRPERGDQIVLPHEMFREWKKTRRFPR